MARIRTIKPEFFTDEDLGELPPAVRLLFIGMWTQADKAGRLKDKPKTLKARCLPFDNLDIEKSLRQLSDSNFIIRYTIGGEQYIQIRTWEEHQRPHHTERESTHPSVENGSLTVNSPLENGEKKGSRNREPSLPFLSFPFPSCISEGFRATWESWVKHRKQIKKPLTEEQVRMQMAEFAKWGEDRSRLAIQHTIKKGWQGLREPDERDGKPTAPAQRTFEDMVKNALETSNGKPT